MSVVSRRDEHQSISQYSHYNRIVGGLQRPRLAQLLIGLSSSRTGLNYPRKHPRQRVLPEVSLHSHPLERPAPQS